MKNSILDFTKEELAQKIKPSFRAKQIFHWIYQKQINSFDDMKNMPKALREELNENYIFNPLEIVHVETSSDGSKKYLFRCHDGYTMETVLLPMKKEIKND